MTNEKTDENIDGEDDDKEFFSNLDRLYGYEEPGRLDFDMVRDFYLINGAERARNGQFATYRSFRYYADGTSPLKEELFRRHGREVRMIAADIIAAGTIWEGLDQLVDLRRAMDLLEHELIAFARAAGWSWRSIARAIGLNASTVHRRFAQLEVPFRERRPSIPR